MGRGRPTKYQTSEDLWKSTENILSKKRKKKWNIDVFKRDGVGRMGIARNRQER
jgi:hypothetical protein